jgi:tartronate-semialdehyde synthase
MPKMTAAEAATRVLESEGVDLVFGQPGAAILPLYQAMNARGTIRHGLVRREEGGTLVRMRSFEKWLRLPVS